MTLQIIIVNAIALLHTLCSKIPDHKRLLQHRDQPHCWFKMAALQKKMLLQEPGRIAELLAGKDKDSPHALF